MKLRKNEMKLRKNEMKVRKNFRFPPWRFPNTSVEKMTRREVTEPVRAVSHPPSRTFACFLLMKMDFLPYENKVSSV